MVYVGCAGWSIPRTHAYLFPGNGAHLQRYARVFPAVEINSSFYRFHRSSTYVRWAASTPDGFRFAVKVHRNLTHFKRLRHPELLDEFLPAVMQLGTKLGVLLVQLPPSLAFEQPIVERFFQELRDRFAGQVAVEPRHASWFVPEVDAILQAYRIARVAADPSPVGDLEPGGWSHLRYVRLHGSPIRYRSSYPPTYLASLFRKLRSWESEGAQVWCMFNNTAEGAAIPNALLLWRFFQST